MVPRMTSSSQHLSPKETAPKTHRAALLKVAAAMKVVSVAANEGAIYHPFFHG